MVSGLPSGKRGWRGELGGHLTGRTIPVPTPSTSECPDGRSPFRAYQVTVPHADARTYARSTSKSPRSHSKSVRGAAARIQAAIALSMEAGS